MRTLFILLVLLAVAPAALAEDRVTGTCEICGGTTYGMRRTLTTGNVKYTTIGSISAPAYCQRCTVDVQSGKIDPKNPPAMFSRDDEEPEEMHNIYSPKELDYGQDKRKKTKADEEAEGGFGALPWVIGIVVALGLLLRFFLK